VLVVEVVVVVAPVAVVAGVSAGVEESFALSIATPTKTAPTTPIATAVPTPMPPAAPAPVPAPCEPLAPALGAPKAGWLKHATKRTTLQKIPLTALLVPRKLLIMGDAFSFDVFITISLNKFTIST